VQCNVKPGADTGGGRGLQGVYIPLRNNCCAHFIHQFGRNKKVPNSPLHPLLKKIPGSSPETIYCNAALYYLLPSTTMFNLVTLEHFFSSMT
jgi:hypothetical protein